MLTKLFGSKARVKILKAFLNCPENKYYIRELARELELQVNSVRRELDNLEKFGLLVSFLKLDKDEKVEEQDDKKRKKVENANRQEKKYYQANPDFILFEEIKAMITKSQILYEENFIEKIKEIGSPKLLLLSGFFTGGTKSPTDILIVGDINKKKLNQVIAEFEKEFSREVNYTIMDLEEFHYRRGITDVFLYEILEEKNLKVINELGV